MKMGIFRKYKHYKQIVEYYEDHMLEMFRCRKYAERGLLLFSAVEPGDMVYLIGAGMTAWETVASFFVKKVEFIGHNDSFIYLSAEPESDAVLRIRNRQFNRIFFRDRDAALDALKRRKESGEKGKVLRGGGGV